MATRVERRTRIRLVDENNGLLETACGVTGLGGLEVGSNVLAEFDEAVVVIGEDVCAEEISCCCCPGKGWWVQNING